MTELVNRYLALSRGTQQLTVVFDKGNNSAANIHQATELGLRVVGSLVSSHHRDLTGVRLQRYSEQVDGKPVFRVRKCSACRSQSRWCTTKRPTSARSGD